MVRVHVDPGSCYTVPLRVRVAEQRLTVEAAERMARLIGEESRSAQIAAGTHAEVGASSAVIYVGEGVPFARIRDIGGTIVRKNAQALRFADGGFAVRARQTGIFYIRSAAAKAPGVIDESYRDCFGTI